MRTYFAIGLAAVSLIGCSTPADQAAQAQREVDRMIQIYGPACEKLGYKNNTDEWRNCVMRFSMREDMERYSSYGPYFPGYGPYFPYPWGPPRF